MLTILADMFMTAAGRRKPDVFSQRNTPAQWAGSTAPAGFSLFRGW